MAWKSIAFDWNHVRAFLVTAEEGSLSAAARELGQAQPTIGRQIRALEEELETTLFERIGNSLVLTQSGIELLDHVRAMADAASRVSLAASGKSRTVEGKVTLSASDVASVYHLPDFVVQLKQQAPLIEVDIVAENQISDLLRREADIAIRHVRPEQPDLIARLAGEGSAHFYGSASYFQNRKIPVCVAELKEHVFIGYGDNSRIISQFSGFGVDLDESQFHFNSQNGTVVWELARKGLGLVVMSDGVGERCADMIRLDLDHEPIRFPVWLATHRELHTSRRIRIVFDALAGYLKENLI